MPSKKSFKIDSSDIIKDAEPLQQHCVSEYLEIEFGDGTGYRHHLNEPHAAAAPPSSTKTSFFVEGLGTSGRFRRVDDDGIIITDEDNNKISSTITTTTGVIVDQEHQQQHSSLSLLLPSSSSFGPKSLKPLMEKIVEIQGTMFLLCQGVLAGYAVLHLFTIIKMNDYDDDDYQKKFLCAYAPMANETRRFFSVFSNISLVASAAKYMYMKRSAVEWKRYPKPQRVLVRASVIIYTITLILTLVSAPTSTQMFYQASSVCDTAGEGSSTTIASKITTWKVLSFLRFAFILLGWFSVCQELLQDKNQFQNVLRINESFVDTLKQKDERISHLVGQELETLPIPELESLLKIHQSSIDETQRVLSHRLKQHL